MFVSTSRNEGFGYAVLEALQSDCVVLSTRTGIAAEILPVQYVCDPKPEKFGNLVLQVANDLEAAKADFQPIWDVAKSMTVDAMASKTLDIYNSLEIER